MTDEVYDEKQIAIKEPITFGGKYNKSKLKQMIKLLSGMKTMSAEHKLQTVIKMAMNL